MRLADALVYVYLFLSYDSAESTLLLMRMAW